MEDKFQDNNPYMAGGGTPSRFLKLTIQETYLQAQGHTFEHLL